MVLEKQKVALIVLPGNTMSATTRPNISVIMGYEEQLENTTVFPAEATRL